MHFLFYSCATLINLMLGGAQFITAYRLSKAGESGFMIGLTPAVWAVIYIITSFVAGRITTTKRAPAMIISSALGMALVSLCFIVFPGLYLQYLWHAMLGILYGIYCTPFQVFSKSFESKAAFDLQGVVRSASSYTMAWSLGMGVGPLLFGMFSPTLCFSFNIAIGIYIAMVVNVLRRGQKQGASDDAPAAETTTQQITQPTVPDMVWLGWVMGASITISTSIIRAMMPQHVIGLGFERADAGYVLCVVNLVQGCFALSLAKTRNWMYSKAPVLGVLTLTWCALLTISFASGLVALYAGAVAYGVASACCYMALVYHSLAHPTKSAKYVSINEMVVGIANMSAPTLVGLAMKSNSFTGLPFLLVAVVSIVASIWAFCIFRKK